jgi:hypothetical protein
MILLRGRQVGDVVNRILEALKLDPPLPKRVVQDIQDALHLLGTRSSIGSFGARDTERRRACALVEYIAREQCGVQIPMDALGKQSYTKKMEDFVKFHQLIGNLRDQWTTNRPKNGNMKAAGSLSAAGPTSKSKFTSKVDVDSLQKSSMNLLAVQLGVIVPHSNVVAKLAQDFFQQILAVIQTKHYGERIHALQDIRKNQRAYEAACFFLVAKDRNSHGWTSSKMQKQLSTTLEEDHQTLDLATFLTATKDFPQREFEMILSYLRNLQQEIEENVASTQARKAETMSSSRKRSRISTSTAAAQPSRKNVAKENPDVQIRKRRSITVDNGPPAVDTACFLLQGIGEDQIEGLSAETTSLHPSSSIYSTIFLEWKQKVLKTAKAKAEEKMKLSDDDGKGVALSTGNHRGEDDETQLDMAVNAILQKHRPGVSQSRRTVSCRGHGINDTACC